MAISRLASQDARGTSATTSAAATYPAATTAGNLLIASCYGGISADTLAISGWTKRQSNVGSGNTASIFDKIADGTETTVTVTGSSTNTRIHIYEYSGAANPVAADGANTGSTAATTTTSSATLTTTNAADLVFASIIFSTTVTSPTVTAPFSLRQVDTTIRLADADQVVATTGSYAATFSWTTSSNTRNIIVAYKAATTAVSTSSSTLLMMGV